MHSIEYADDDYLENCKQMFAMVYPATAPRFVGIAQDKTSLIAECVSNEGTYYYRVTDDSVSRSFNNLEDADRG